RCLSRHARACPIVPRIELLPDRCSDTAVATSSCPALRTRRLRLCRLASIALPALAGALAAPASADERFAPDTVAAATPLRPATVQSPRPRPAAVTAYAPGRGDIVARASAASGSSRDAAAAASTRLASKPW